MKYKKLELGGRGGGTTKGGYEAHKEMYGRDALRFAQGGELPNEGLKALAKESPETVRNMGFDVAAAGAKMPKEVLEYFKSKEGKEMAMQGMKILKAYGGKMAQEGVLNESEGQPGVMTQIDSQFESMLAENGMKQDLIDRVMKSIGQGRTGERKGQAAMEQFDWDGTPEGLSRLPVHQIAEVFKSTTGGPNLNMYEILQRSANAVGADWKPSQNQLYTTIHHSGARNLAPDQLDTLFEESGWADPKNAEITSNFIQQAVAGNVNFMGGEATGNRGRGMAYEMDTSRLGQGYQGRGYTFGRSEFDNQEGVFESGESDAIRYEFENAIETPESFMSKGALKDGTFNLNTVLNRREFVPTDEPQRDFQAIRLQKEYNPELMRLPLAKMLRLKDRPEFPEDDVIPRPPLPSSGLGREPIYQASDFLPGAAGVDERGRMRPESGTFTSSLGFPDPTAQPLNLEALRAMQRKRGGRIYRFGGRK